MPEGVVGLAERFGLPRPAARQLAQLQALLASDPAAPSALRDPRRILDDHLADSLVALEVAALEETGQVVDIGSGAGLPGLPLAIALPRVRFALLESVGRKCSFIRSAAAACALENAAVIQTRAESFTAGLDRFDTATCRAVAPLEVVLEYAAPLLRLGGSLIAWRGRRDLQAERHARAAAEELGLRADDVLHVVPYPAAHDRYLHLFSKVRPTPEGFPRRPGMAAKRPLGG